MDLTEVPVNLDRAVQMFGVYLKYCVMLVLYTPVPAKNTLVIMMHSQRLLQQKSKLPNKVHGVLMSELSQTPEGLDVYARNIVCGEPIEKLNYTAKYPPICVYCAKDTMECKEYYPQCIDGKQPKIQKS